MAVALAATAALAGAGLAGAHYASAATAGCQVSYTVASQWPGGFGANVNVNNLGDPINGWRLTWSFTAGPANMEHWGPQGLQQYFDKYEPGNKLVIPEQY